MERQFIVRGDLAVILIHKCASSSILLAAHGLGIEARVYPVEEMARYPTRAVMIREPHARLESTWSMWRRHPDYKDTNFAAWVVEVCERPWTDWHVAPMVTFLEGFNPTEIVRWDFARMAALIGAPIPHANGNPRPHACQWTPRARQAFAVAYAGDLALWG